MRGARYLAGLCVAQAAAERAYAALNTPGGSITEGTAMKANIHRDSYVFRFKEPNLQPRIGSEAVISDKKLHSIRVVVPEKLPAHIDIRISADNARV